MRWTDLGRLLAPALMVGALVLGSETGAAAAGGCAASAPVKVPAKTRVVGTGTAASCTLPALRRAVAAGGHVVFRCGGAATIAVTSEIQVPSTTVIDGAGQITLDGRGSGRILRVLMDGTLSVRDLRLINGGGGSTDRGGAIFGDYRNRIEVIGSTFTDNSVTGAGGAIATAAESRLTVVDSTFHGNRSANVGGAIYSLLSPLTVVGSTFTSNSASTNGGAILTDGAAAPGRPGTIAVCGATFRDNSAHDSGGGGFFWAYAPQKIIVDRTTFEGNVAATGTANGEGHAGAARLSVGLSEENRSGTVIVQNSSVLSNSSRRDGGAFYLDCPPICEIRNTTFYKNSTGEFGGAVFGDGHHDKNVTYAYNEAKNQGGAIFGARNVYDNTVFVGNTAHNQWGGAQTCNTAGKGSRVVQWGTTSPDSSQKCAGIVISKNPRLAVPSRNQGGTLSMMPAAGSPLLNAGADCLTTDQRGVSRQKARCDIGAVQRISVIAPSSATPSPSVSPLMSLGAKPAPTVEGAPVSTEPALAAAVTTDDRPSRSLWSAVAATVLTALLTVAAVLTLMGHRRRFLGAHRSTWSSRRSPSRRSPLRSGDPSSRSESGRDD